MRRTKRSGGFFPCLLLNLLLNWEGVIPAALLFALHRWRGWPLWWAGLALALWIGGLIVWMLVLGWASDCGSRRDEVSISAVADSLKKAVKYKVEQFTGMIVDTVNVNIIGVKL